MQNAKDDFHCGAALPPLNISRPIFFPVPDSNDDQDLIVLQQIPDDIVTNNPLTHRQGLHRFACHGLLEKRPKTI